MRFKLDENLPQEATSVLLQAGHDAVSVRDEHLTGTEDDRLAEICRDEGRILVTLDVGFSDPRTYPTKGSPGILV